MSNAPRTKRILRLVWTVLALGGCTKTSLVGVDERDASEEPGSSSNAGESTGNGSSNDGDGAMADPETPADAGAPSNSGGVSPGPWPVGEPLDCESGQSLKIVTVAQGLDRRCAIVEGGQLYCWGRDPRGGNAHVNAPLRVDQLADVSAVAVGHTHICAVTSGSVWCWGQNQSGQLGDGTKLTHAAPTKVEGLSGVVRISANGQSTCAVTNQAELYCWGEIAGAGALSPRKIEQAWDVQDVTVGYEHACIITSGTRVQCFGENSFGQLGNGTNVARVTPTDTGVEALMVRAGLWSTCAVTPEHEVFCWGANDSGQLGDGTLGGPIGDGMPTGRTSPVRMLGIHDAERVSVDVDTSCVHLTSGEVMCAGGNQFGALGTTDPDNSRVESTPVAADALGTVRLFEGGCIARGALGLECWGPNGFGSVGDGTAEDRFTPVPVLGFNCATP